MNQFPALIPLPCSSCIITHVQAGLQYPNGSYANINTGMWMHHVVVGNLARTGTTCPQFGEFVFASGNERTPANICVNGYVLYLSSFNLSRAPDPISTLLFAIPVALSYRYLLGKLLGRGQTSSPMKITPSMEPLFITIHRDRDASFFASCKKTK